MTSKHEPSPVRVKLRAGNKSAQLERSIYRERAGRKLPVSIGSVDADANLETGYGVRMKKPFTFADLTPEDKTRIREKFGSVRGPDGEVVRPGFVSLDKKLSQVLELLGRGAAPPSTAQGALAAVDVIAGSALDRLETAVEDAIAEVRAQRDMLAKSGLKLTNVSHTGVAARNPSNRMDQLQARANRVRAQLLPKFVDACRDLGLMKRAG